MRSSGAVSAAVEKESSSAGAVDSAEEAADAPLASTTCACSTRDGAAVTARASVCSVAASPRRSTSAGEQREQMGISARRSSAAILG